MLIFFAWFSQDRRQSRDEQQAAWRRLEESQAGLIPEGWSHHRVEGHGWGIHLAHADLNGWRWPLFHETADTTTVSIGLPVGISAGTSPHGMAEQLLAGHDVHTEIVPPFAMLALDRGAGRFVLQQDWLGMARVFEYSSHGIFACSNRPTLLPAFFGAPLRPNRAGWSHYAASGHFGGNSSPADGASLLEPGARLTGQQAPNGAWTLMRSRRANCDDFIADAVNRENHDDSLFDEVAGGFTRVAASTAALREGQVTLGLSGGKDSRLIAAALVAAGVVPRFKTNVDLSTEGEIARALTDILAERRGITVEHAFGRVATSSRVHTESLQQRTLRLQKYYDYQFPSTYLERPARPEHLARKFGPPVFSGAGAEIGTAYWHPRRLDGTPTAAQMESQVMQRLSKEVPAGAQSPEVRERQRELSADITRRATALGVEGPHILDYAFLTERVRRWCTSAYNEGLITLFMTREYIQAAFATSAADQRQLRLHTYLLNRLVPEWADVPFADRSSRGSAALIWDGDGLPALQRLLAQAGGPLTTLLDLGHVGTVIQRCAENGAEPADAGPLRQFAALAVAESAFQGSTSTEPPSWRDRLRVPRRRLTGDAVLPARDRQSRAR